MTAVGTQLTQVSFKEKIMMRHLVSAIALVSLVVGSRSVMGGEAETAPGFWTTPTIQGFGRIHELPMAAYRPDRRITYKIVFALTKAVKDAGEVNPALDRVARTVNLYVASGVPLSQLKIVAVAYGEATPLALDDAHYRTKFGVSNPNLPLIALLRKAGVDIAVCGQALAENHFDYAWVDKSVTTALSGITTVTTLEQSGYVLMPL
jgi:intracellular sulfur oxidation DsrE/DsrF family protein